MKGNMFGNEVKKKFKGMGWVRSKFYLFKWHFWKMLCRIRGNSANRIAENRSVSDGDVHVNNIFHIYVEKINGGKLFDGEIFAFMQGRKEMTRSRYFSLLF